MVQLQEGGSNLEWLELCGRGGGALKGRRVLLAFAMLYVVA